jgi:Secretory lipase
MQKNFLILPLALCSAALAYGQPATNPVAKAQQEEAANTLPITDFFERGPPPHGSEPGRLLRSEDFTGYDLPAGVQVKRILYVSKSELGHPTVASAIVITPTRSVPTGGWPVLLWAHGTTGVAPQCGPSVTKSDGYYTKELVQQGIRHGFAVVSIDYSGMPAGETFEYLWKHSNANDAMYAIAPARAAVSSLSKTQWVAIGHSQGGQTTCGLAEAMASGRDPTYLGSVSLAPGINSERLIDHLAATKDQVFYTVYMAYAIKSVYPDFDLKSMLKPAGLAAYRWMTTQRCIAVAYYAFHETRPGTLLKKDWTKSHDVQQFLERNSVTGHPIGGQLFVASGSGDESVPASLIEPEVRALCKTGAEVFYKKYPGDHGGMMSSSFKDQIDWIMDRFHHRPSTNSCIAGNHT